MALEETLSPFTVEDKVVKPSEVITALKEKTAYELGNIHFSVLIIL